MEEMIRTPACEPETPSTGLSMHKDSHVISKFKPKIRIVHIFAPEIIKTDVANFRELVQRLTGKPVGRKGSKKKSKKVCGDSSEESENGQFNRTDRMEFCNRSVFEFGGGGERVKEEEEVEMIWGSENSTSFFSGLGDLDGFIQGISEFPLVPLSSSSSHVDVFGESGLS